ncbi:hypothetical protein ACK6D9_12185 [Hoeflea sp. Naph1]|uniref:hypothetical protein n=1 Tax=Hoeflea sp. Naph1 TaxID=3388653 RepID=UPI0039903226
MSKLQTDILEALPALTEGMDCQEAPTRVELVMALGLAETESNRVAVSRAVSRLYKRGLILHVWGIGHRYSFTKLMLARGRTGYARATPEQVLAFKARQREFFERQGFTPGA